MAPAKGKITAENATNTETNIISDYHTKSEKGGRERTAQRGNLSFIPHVASDLLP